MRTDVGSVLAWVKVPVLRQQTSEWGANDVEGIVVGWFFKDLSRHRLERGWEKLILGQRKELWAWRDEGELLRSLLSVFVWWVDTIHHVTQILKLGELILLCIWPRGTIRIGERGRGGEDKENTPELGQESVFCSEGEAIIQWAHVLVQQLLWSRIGVADKTRRKKMILLKTTFFSGGIFAGIFQSLSIIFFFPCY